MVLCLSVSLLGDDREIQRYSKKVPHVSQINQPENQTNQNKKVNLMICISVHRLASTDFLCMQGLGRTQGSIPRICSFFEFRISVADSDATGLGRELEFGWNQIRVKFNLIPAESSLGLRVQGLGCRSGHDTNPLP